MNDPDPRPARPYGDHAAALHPLDAIPIGPRHRLFIAIISLAAFFDFFDLMLGGAVTAALLHDRWSTLQLNAIFLSITGVGGVISNLAGGALADRYGRRRILRLALLIVGSSTIFAACASSIYWLLGARLVASLGMAAIPAIGWTMIVEILPADQRGRWSGIAGFIGQLAIFASALIAYLVIPGGGWRWMFVLPGIGCILLCLVAAILPESPRWLEAVGRQADAQRAMRAIGALPASTAPDTPIAAGAAAPRRAPSAAALFRGPLGRRMLLAIILAVGGNVAMTAFLTWLPTILLGRGFTITHSLGYNLVISIGSPAGALLGALIADRIGRRRGLVVTALLAILFAAAFAATGGTALLATGFVFLLAMGLLLSIIMGLYLPELFPTVLRARATAIAMASVRLASVGLPFALLALLQGYGVAGAMGLIGACLAVIVVAVPILGPEMAARPLDSLDA